MYSATIQPDWHLDGTPSFWLTGHTQPHPDAPVAAPPSAADADSSATAAATTTEQAADTLITAVKDVPCTVHRSAGEGEWKVEGDLSVTPTGRHSVVVGGFGGKLRTAIHAPFHAIKCESGVCSVDMTAAGLVVAGCASGYAHVYRWRSWDYVALLKGHIMDVLVAKFFPSGQVILTGSADMQLRVWSAESGHCAAIMKGHTRGILAADFIDRGRNLLSGSRDGTACLWDVATANAIFAWPFDSPVHALAVVSNAPSSLLVPASEATEPLEAGEVGTDGKLAVLATSDGFLRAIDVRQKEVTSSIASLGSINTVQCVNADATVHAAAGYADGSIRLWDLRSARPLWHLPSWRGAGITSLQLCSDSSLWATSTDGACRHWAFPSSPEDATIVEQLSGPNLDSCRAVSHVAAPDGSRRLIAGGNDHILRAYDLSS